MVKVAVALQETEALGIFVLEAVEVDVGVILQRPPEPLAPAVGE